MVLYLRGGWFTAGTSGKDMIGLAAVREKTFYNWIGPTRSENFDKGVGGETLRQIAPFIPNRLLRVHSYIQELLSYELPSGEVGNTQAQVCTARRMTIVLFTDDRMTCVECGCALYANVLGHALIAVVEWYVMASLPACPGEGTTSIHAALISEVHDIPMDVLIRPFPPEVDEEKVKSIMDTLELLFLARWRNTISCFVSCLGTDSTINYHFMFVVRNARNVSNVQQLFVDNDTGIVEFLFSAIGAVLSVRLPLPSAAALAHNVLRSIVCDIHACGKFSLIVAETADVAGVEQLSINIRIVKDLEPEELFLGLYSTSSTTGESLFKPIMDVLCRPNIQLQNMHGQCYDGAADMSDMFKGLNLALQDAARQTTLIRDCLQWSNDVAVIISYSPKRKAQFAEICLVNEENVSSGVHPLCPTRLTARVASISGILNTYNSVLAMLSNIAESKEEISSRARGLLDQLTHAEVYLGFLVYREVFTPRELLSRVLQDTKVTVAGGCEAISCTIIRNGKKFVDLWTEMTEQAKILELEEPKLPRNRRNPKQYDYDESTSAPSHQSWRDLDEIGKRFNQPGYEKCRNIESCLLSSPVEWNTSTTNCLQDLGSNILNFRCKLNMLPKLVPSVNSVNDIVVAFKALHPETRYLFPELEKNFKLLLVVPSSSATAEQSFSMLQRIKTFLRSTMSQSRLTHLCILNVHEERAQASNINSVMKEFVNNDYNHTIF
ncbi:hypothetical protein PR048_015888, partial [Dryococelus australis]